MRKTWEPWEDEFLRESYFHLGVKSCAEHLNRSPGSIAHRVSRLGFDRKGTTYLRAQYRQGYISIQGHFIRKFLHTLIGEMKIGRALKKDEVVHHIDGDILNNHPDNLAVMTRAAHQWIHWGTNCELRRDPETGRFV